VRPGALIGYARVSISGQLLDRQQHALAEAGCLRVFRRQASLYAWMAAEESRRRSERTSAGLERRKREGLPVGRQPGATDKKPRRRSGYMARWERERAAAG
jgi:DNA invertase Pin-like site-specific DNA recombinase